VEWVETTGRTIEDAKEAALDQLGVDESDAEFEVVEEPRAGLFGRLRSEARVRARVRPTAPRAKDDRRDRRRRGRTNGEGRDATRANANGEDSASSSGGQSSPGARANAAEGSRANSAPSGGTSSSSASRGAPGDAATVTAAVTENSADTGADVSIGTGAPAAAPRTEQSVDDRRGRNGDRDQKGGDVEVPLDQQGEIAEDFLTKLVAEFGLQAAVKVVRPDEDTVDVRLEGADLGLLIGPRGATLLALQDLTRTVVHHRTGAGNGRIHVDVGGYRQKRTDALVRFAQQVAATVQASGTRTVLEPMTAADRKVVHDAITPIDGVSTISEGEEPERRVVVVPAGS
jgi:spoIIIJ-associated protein